MATSGSAVSTTTTQIRVGSAPTSTIPVGAHRPNADSTTGAGTLDTIGVEDGHLEFNGRPHRFLGVNAYEIATQWGTNPGCGDMESQAQLDQLFSSLAPNSLVRIWAFQGSMAINIQTHQLDWAPLDRVFDTAAAYGQRLVVTVTGQSGTCDGLHWQDPAWYDGGFMDVYNSPSNSDGRGFTPMSYWDYLQALVSRYKDSPALGMWEPVSEPEASSCPSQDEPTDCGGNQTCPDEAVAAQALRHFFDVVGGEIHALDPDHLVESGTIGSGQCGISGSDFSYVGASAGIDVLSVHDYYGSAPMGGDPVNGMAARFAEAAALGKPVITGEVGLTAGGASGCASLADRVPIFEAKVQAQLQGGSSGLLLWDWQPVPTTQCGYDTYPGDPLLGVIGHGPPT